MNCIRSHRLYSLQSTLLRRPHITALFATTLLVAARGNTAFISALTNQRERISSTTICGSDTNTDINLCTSTHKTSLAKEKSSSMKSAQDLQIQWAGGRDVWPRVPTENGFVSIQTKVQDDEDDDSSNVAGSTSDWPTIVKESTLFGFGAYNPRGQTLPDDINRKQHALLKHDIEESLEKYPQFVAQFWEGSSIWEDSSSEKGFILAFREEKERGLQLSINLARRYNQGAIYKFTMEEDGRLMRDTVAVLDKGTDAKVEVVIDALLV